MNKIDKWQVRRKNIRPYGRGCGSGNTRWHIPCIYHEVQSLFW